MATAKNVRIDDLAKVKSNLLETQLVEEAVRRGEGEFTAYGAFAADTGVHTGRSPKDKFIVRDKLTEGQVWWDNNAAISPENFDTLHADFLEHLKGKELFAQDLYGGADPANRIKVRVYTEYAWHSLFIRTMLIRPPQADLAGFVPDMTIIDLPSFKADPKRHGARTETIIGVDLSRGLVLIGNSSYAGEMKKSVFGALNFFLPAKGILPMHCSANVGKNGGSALFFGLSGTGKTTLSADPQRILLGDDEHGWSDNGIFNFEGGCYAKTINLSADAEPEIYAATKMFGSILENVAIDPETRIPDYDDVSKTENGRVAYPLHYIPNASETGRAEAPKNVMMLTADAFGVMPPIARLTPQQAMYHFLSGYTAKVAGTEKGVTEPQATFSTCFGAPFMPRHPSEYGELLRQKIAKHGSTCWLISTGWTGGPFGTGKRMPIKATRALLSAALSGQLDNVEFRKDPNFGFEVPVAVPGVPSALLDPRSTWDDKAAYDVQARKLVGMFQENFKRFEEHVAPDVIAASPGVFEPAE
ncbi:phosphoenolpyruvate carboxykinase [ATP] [Terrihabitans soli]|uniref:Phosphoenolpyruvate carboxykinase (ATP) n=2 Tax=Terrihabitans soli TaxID=708113 RepID=A0A6S6QYJ3_9HYPH|nr:phosphoenolpyruvate carboxykinase [Terrihabitans soli]BCJ92101.1 phosphoenolpyruvate carboxykinase [ATP] [Terrihabitans soli]